MNPHTTAAVRHLQRPTRQAVPVSVNGNAARNGHIEADVPARAVLLPLADVTPKKVRWLWAGRIPLGKVTVLDGDPDLGKSTVTLDLAARVTRHVAMPDDTLSDLGEPRGVVLLSAEDDAADTIRPRLDAAGADVSRIVLLHGVNDSPGERGERGPTIADLSALEEAVSSVSAALVVIDPLMAHLPDERDSHRDHDIRRALRPIAKFAERLGVAVLMIRHLNKNAAVGNALYRGGGSIGIIGAARSGLLIAPDPDAPDSGRRILACSKHNLSADTPALAYRLETGDEVPRILWEGPTAHTASALLATRLPDNERSELDEAKAFLTDFLADGDRPAREVKGAAREAGIAARTLERARPLAGVRSGRRGFAGPFMWSLSRQNPLSRQPLDPGENGEIGENGGLVGEAIRRFGNSVTEVRSLP